MTGFLKEEKETLGMCIHTGKSMRGYKEKVIVYQPGRQAARETSQTTL